MYSKQIISIIIVSILFINGCAASEGKEDDENISVKINQLDSWLNLMPGGPSSFHIAGEIAVINESETLINKFSIEEILIYQDEKLLYKISPFLETIPMGEDFSIQKENEKKFLFGTRPGLQISKELNPEHFISAELKFSADETIVNLSVDSIRIEKAY
jgi:hypothetical protein